MPMPRNEGEVCHRLARRAWESKTLEQRNEEKSRQEKRRAKMFGKVGT